MRIIYCTITGEQRCREFASWQELCQWLVEFYPLCAAARQANETLDAIFRA